jgi:hypothetical protein
MDFPGGILLGTIAALLVVFSVAIALFIAAVWFGLHVVAPRIRRAVDRAETEEEQPGDRAD